MEIQNNATLVHTQIVMFQVLNLMLEITVGLTTVVVVDGRMDLTVCVFSGCINLSFAYVEGESLLMALKDVALSSGRSDTHKRSYYSTKEIQWM